MDAHGAINEPLKQFRNHYQKKFRECSEAFLEKLIAESKVNARENAALTAEIRRLEKAIAAHKSRLGRWRFLQTLLTLLAVAGGITGTLYILPSFLPEFGEMQPPPEWAAGGLAALIFSRFLIFGCVNKKIAAIRDVLSEDREKRDSKIEQAWVQMLPLNRLFRWDTVANLVSEACPLFQFDRFVPEKRVAELCRHFGWHGTEDSSQSVLCCHSGTIRGNPFVIADARTFEWGTETYTGTLDISWREKETYYDSEGKARTRTVTKYQTLVATVEKPVPAYDRLSFVVYGHEAAPALYFSRMPSELSALGNGFWDRRKIKSAVKSLRKRSKDLSDDFTIMSNEEFDALFSAVNRSDERQFRLLFTPLAQQEMLSLLRSKEPGYGDDFCFRKRGMINTVLPGHLQNMDFSASPDIFRHYDLAEIKRVFLSYTDEFFRAVYFAFAPLFAIPLYQQKNPAAAEYAGEDCGVSDALEHEALANHLGTVVFAHPDSVTQNILKTKIKYWKNGLSGFTVTANGFRGIPRTDYVEMFGGDGRWHSVPVEWVEYLPVSQDSTVIFKDLVPGDEELQLREWQATLDSCGVMPGTIHRRRNIAYFILK